MLILRIHWISTGSSSSLRSNRWRRSDDSHTSFKTAKGCTIESRLGKTTRLCPGSKWPRNCRVSSRNKRFARFRLTAPPNRFPTTIPIRLLLWSVRQITILNKEVEIRRPCSLAYSISRLRLRNSSLSPPPFDMTIIPGEGRFVQHIHFEVRSPRTRS